MDPVGADRLERMRTSLARALSILASTNPPIRRSDIVSIHQFTTRPGATLLPSLADRYNRAIDQGRYPWSIQIDARDIAPTDVYGPAVPATAYANVGSFVRGSILVPRVLANDLRLRADWDTVEDTVQVPFLMSLPREGDTFPVALHVVGFGRSPARRACPRRRYGRWTAGAVLAVELRCHGDRSAGADGRCVDNRTPAEAAMLADALPNNGNPEFRLSDQIPDASGIGYFPGDPRQLRDTQAAAMLELMHVIGTLRDGTAFASANIPIDPRSIHLLAQGYTSLPAAAAAAYSRRRVRTIQFLAGGANLSELILNGAQEQRAAFDASLPGTIGGAQADTLLIRLKEFLDPIELTAFSEELRSIYALGTRVQGILLAHPQAGGQGLTSMYRRRLGMLYPRGCSCRPRPLANIRRCATTTSSSPASWETLRRSWNGPAARLQDSLTRMGCTVPPPG